LPKPAIIDKTAVNNPSAQREIAIPMNRIKLNDNARMATSDTLYQPLPGNLTAAQKFPALEVCGLEVLIHRQVGREQM
jgi:hypothetical protein